MIRTVACLVVLAAAALPGRAAPQEPAGQEPAGHDHAGHDHAQEAPSITPEPMPQQPVGSLVPSIEALRQQTRVDVVSCKEQLDLPLHAVNFEHDVVLLLEGEPVTREEVRRALCMVLGVNEIDQLITYSLAQIIQDELKEAGHLADVVKVSDAEVLAQFEEQKKMAPQTMSISGEEWEQQIRDNFGWDNYVAFQKVQIGFEKIFLPDPPPGFLEEQKARFDQLDKEQKEQQAAGGAPAPAGTPPAPPPVPEGDLSFIPPTTWKLLDERFHQYVKESYLRGQEIHPMLRMGIMADVKRRLMASTDILFRPELPADVDPGVFFTVSGRPVLTEQVFTLIAPRVTPALWQLALREVLCYRALDRALARDDVLLTPAQADAEFESMAKEYQNSIIPLEHAVRLRGFYSVHQYRPYFVRKAAFKKLVAARTSEEQLRQHFQAAGRLFFEHGTVGGSVLFIPGEDRTASRAAMDAALARIAAGEDFTAVAEEVGTFPQGPSVSGALMRPQVRLQLRNSLGESEYVAFVTGYSLADEVFYCAVEGEVVGPVYRDYTPQLTGWLAFQVGHYYNPGRQRSFEEQKDACLEDLTDLTFPRYTSEALAACAIELPPGP